MKKNKLSIIVFLLAIILSFNISAKNSKSALKSIDTNLTITKVRSTNIENKQFIAASSYEGTVLLLNKQGDILAKNILSGYMNHDLWISDINNDNKAEILTANADGHVYCVDSKGKLMWSFSPDNAPMYSVCSFKDNGKTYIVCGSMDTFIYYLSSEGKLIKKVDSRISGGLEKPFGKDSKDLDKKAFIANVIRCGKDSEGKTFIAVLASINSMQTHGALYLYRPFAENAFQKNKIKGKGTAGDIKMSKYQAGKWQEILIGSSGGTKDMNVSIYNPENNKELSYDLLKICPPRTTGASYHCLQSASINDNGKLVYLTLFSDHLVLAPENPTRTNTTVLNSSYCFNDFWYDDIQNYLYLASSQSGGSCIYQFDLNNKKWKKDYENIQPRGKLKKLIDLSTKTHKEIKNSKKLSSYKTQPKVYMMTENMKNEEVSSIANSLMYKYKNPIFLQGPWIQKVENWDRSTFGNTLYENKRDRRKKYILTHKQSVKELSDLYEKTDYGVAYWAGHGNDPMMFSKSTLISALEKANGKKTVWIYPEVVQHGPDFEYLMNNHFYPLAQDAQGKNANIFFRTKHTFWLGMVYDKSMKDLVSGKYHDVFVPSMEETTDKSMELSLSGRLGLWAAGSVDAWGTRCAYDNVSFDRLRQYGFQRVPSHFLRTMIYHTSLGASYVNNISSNTDYMSILWELIARGILYVPKRNEIVSFNPIHLTMLSPDSAFSLRSTNCKWLTQYNENYQKENNMVFSHLNGTWPGAPVTEWDFSRYAAGVKDRHLNFLAPYPNGMVMITPPYDANAYRGKLVDNLNPIYKSIIKNYYTDGRYYYATPDKKGEKMDANTYYKTIASDIKNSAKLLPVTVYGSKLTEENHNELSTIAWVAAQAGPKELRITLIDNGYINPSASIAHLTFHTVQPISIIDLLTNETFKVDKNGKINIPIECGGFRFLSVLLKDELK